MALSLELRLEMLEARMNNLSNKIIDFKDDLKRLEKILNDQINRNKKMSGIVEQLKKEI
jgi:hypothetical protein